MKVISAQDVLQPMLQTAEARNESLAKFQATLDSATQSLARSGANTAAPKPGATGDKRPSDMSSAEYLADYLRKGPAQHIREAILKEMGLSEAQVDALPPGQRTAVENAIAEKVRELMDAQDAKARQHVSMRPSVV